MADDLDPAAVERAARAFYDHDRGTRRWEGLPDFVRQDYLDKTRAALAAARAGEVEPCGHPGGGDVDGAGLCAWHRTAQRGGEAVDREALVDSLERTLLAEATRHGRQEGSGYGCVCGERVFYVAERDWSMATHIAHQQAMILAARGDAPVRSVNPRQVESLARARADEAASVWGGQPWSDDSWAHIRRERIQAEAQRLRAVGIEVTP